MTHTRRILATTLGLLGWAALIAGAAAPASADPPPQAPAYGYRAKLDRKDDKDKRDWQNRQDRRDREARRDDRRDDWRYDRRDPRRRDERRWPDAWRDEPRGEDRWRDDRRRRDRDRDSNPRVRDTDGDRVPDFRDDYPNDPTRS